MVLLLAKDDYTTAETLIEYLNLLDEVWLSTQVAYQITDEAVSIVRTATIIEDVYAYLI